MIVWLAVTTLVVTGKVTEDWPAGTVAVAGTTATVPLLLSVTITPPEGDGPLNVTRPMTLAPPGTAFDERLSVLRVGGGASACSTESNTPV